MNHAFAGERLPTWAVRLVWFLPCVALGTEQVSAAEGTISAALIFIGVQVVSLVGHGAASLPEWANWNDTEGSSVDVSRRKLKIIQGILVSLLAGNASFYGGQYWANLHEIPGLIGSGIAAYGGDRFLSRLTGKTTNPGGPSP